MEISADLSVLWLVKDIYVYFRKYSKKLAPYVFQKKTAIGGIEIIFRFKTNL